MGRGRGYQNLTRCKDKSGRVRWRFRRKGHSAYIHGERGSPQFDHEYWVALEASERPAPSFTSQYGTFAWLVEQYLISGLHRGKADLTRRDWARRLDWLLRSDREGGAGIGDLPVKDFRPRHVRALIDRQNTPSKQNKVRGTLSMILNYALRLELIAENPVKATDKAKDKSEGFHTWTEAEINRYLEVHGRGTQARLAMFLALNTGAARQDLARLGWQNVQSGRIDYRRGKTGMEVSVRIFPELHAELELLPKGQLLFLPTETGVQRTTNGFGNWFKERALQAGITVDGASIHGLRKAGATRLAEAGATDLEIAAFLGHNSTREASRYVRAANRKKLTDAGTDKIGTLVATTICPSIKDLDKMRLENK